MDRSLILAGLIFLLTSFSAGGLLLVAFYPRMGGRTRLDRRVDAVAPPTAPVKEPGAREEARKRSVDDTVREAAEKQQPGKTRKASLLARLRQADLAWTTRTYWLVSLAAGLAVAALIAILIGLGAIVTLGFGISGGLLLPHAYVQHRRQQRFKRFAAEFPNAVDVIVRGIKSGLPVVDCLKIVAAEAQEPVKSEFRVIVEDQTLGMPLGEAVQRLPERMPTSEASFFAIVIAIQSRTGGSLSEALGNLSKVLRDRVKMKAKIRAMSSEAKASGGIIAAMPLGVSGMVYLTSPQYISLLFTDMTGNLVLAGCAIWMAIGVFVMRKMINFDF